MVGKAVAPLAISKARHIWKDVLNELQEIASLSTLTYTALFLLAIFRGFCDFLYA
jgi:hypothetical protein